MLLIIDVCHSSLTVADQKSHLNSLQIFFAPESALFCIYPTTQFHMNRIGEDDFLQNSRYCLRIVLKQNPQIHIVYGGPMVLVLKRKQFYMDADLSPPNQDSSGCALR